MSIRERVGELAVMTLGFHGARSSARCCRAALSHRAGAPRATLGLAQALKSVAGWSPALGPLASFIVTSSILVQGLFLALLIGIVSGVVPAWGASRRSVAATLREVF
jgi:ABC-type antimicrobial peptide transport system permease subunit